MRVVVLTGGRSGEHEVSLRSGAAVLTALAELEHHAMEWRFARTGGSQLLATGAPPTEAKDLGTAIGEVMAFAPDVAFIAMHGGDGEDGRLQGLLDLLNIPYQGSGLRASALGLDKAATKERFRARGIAVAPDVVARRGVPHESAAIVAELGLPLVLKTRESGSSVGVELVSTDDDAKTRLAALLMTSDEVVCEQFVEGREFTAAVLERVDGSLEALPIVEIRPKTAAFFDFEAKYTPGATDEICPAPIAPALRDDLQAMGLAAHQALGCRGYSRTDVIVGPNGPIALETNTLPGLTKESLLPKAASASGLTFSALIARLLARARTD